MANLLLLDIRPETEAFIRDAIGKEPCHIESLAFSDTFSRSFSHDYDLIIAEADFTDAARIRSLYSLRSRFSRCMIVFACYEENQDLIKTSYMLGDGALVFPMNADKLLRILHWYLSSGQTRHMEAIKHDRSLAGHLRARFKGLRLFLFLAVLSGVLIGALIGFFGANQWERPLQVGFTPFDKLIEAFHALRR